MKQLDYKNLRTSFYEFGKHMRTAAIATVLTLIPPISAVAGIIALVFIFLAIADLRRLNYQLNNENLETFRSKYIRSFVIGIIGFVILAAGGGSMAASFIVPTYVSLPHPAIFISGIVFASAFLLAGLIMVIVSFSTQMKAWESLKLYFQANKSLFPENLQKELVDGCDNLRTGALLMALGIFVITAIIGWIFQVVGYFKLAKLDSIMYYDVSEPQAKEILPQVKEPESEPKPVEPPKQDLEMEISNFCPNCGAKLSGRGGKYCALCGSQIS